MYCTYISDFKILQKETTFLTSKRSVCLQGDIWPRAKCRTCRVVPLIAVIASFFPIHSQLKVNCEVTSYLHWLKYSRALLALVALQALLSFLALHFEAWSLPEEGNCSSVTKLLTLAAVDSSPWPHTTLHRTAQHHTAPQCTAQHHTKPHRTAPHCRQAHFHTSQHINTAQYSTDQISHFSCWSQYIALTRMSDKHTECMF